MGVKFGTEHGTFVLLLRAKFHPISARDLRSPPPRQISPHRCNNKGIGPPKLKFLLIFDQNVEYKRPAGAYPSRDFHKIYRVSTPCQDAFTVKIVGFARGIMVLWGF